jgi:hypothetical protein
MKMKSGWAIPQEHFCWFASSAVQPHQSSAISNEIIIFDYVQLQTITSTVSRNLWKWLYMSLLGAFIKSIEKERDSKVEVKLEIKESGHLLAYYQRLNNDKTINVLSHYPKLIASNFLNNVCANEFLRRVTRGEITSDRCTSSLYKSRYLRYIRMRSMVR